MLGAVYFAIKTVMLSGPFFKRERTSESGIVSIQYLSELLNNESEADRSGSALESTEQEVQEQNQEL